MKYEKSMFKPYKNAILNSEKYKIIHIFLSKKMYTGVDLSS